MTTASDDATLAGTRADEPAARSHTGTLEPTAVVGRYVVLRKLGAGGMGVVYAAYDPELDRKVALKLLLPGSGGDTGRLRLIREAQALARLSHPHVVGIHDVGTVGGQVWLAMEFVQGRTLSQWVTTPRRWPEVLEVLRKAGEGLAAAHAAGLLHRDFKPDNVMVGDDGRVRVMDFGLARVDAGASSMEGEPSQLDSRELRVSTNAVTRVGALVGTPSYMAPEQFAHTELSAATDQFAFCVTLWETLYGERPFSGDSPPELMANVLEGRFRTPTRGRAVPGWLRRACERGLSLAPEQRWPSMTALLETLAKGRQRAAVRKGLAAVGVLALLGAGVEAQRRWDLAERTSACETSGAEVDAAWNAELEQQLRDAFVATGASQASMTADKVTPWLDQQAEAWRQARVEVCLDADVRGRWDADMRDRALWCLDQRRMELGSLVERLIQADVKGLQRAVQTAAALPLVARCRDEEVLHMLAPPTPEDREALRAIRADVMRASNLGQAGRPSDALELARAALERAEALGWPPLVAEARFSRGVLLGWSGAHAEAEAELEQAYFDSVRGVAPDVALDAASALVGVMVDAGRYPEARRWARLADVALADVPDGARIEHANLLDDLATIDRAVGAYDEARARYEQVLAMREQALGPEHPKVAATLGSLATIYQVTGAHDEAKALHERALAILEQALGPDHPNVIGNLNNLANVYYSTGNYDEAKRLYERAVASLERTLGPEHPNVARTLNNLAAVHQALGDNEGAKRLYTRALGIAEQTMGLEHPDAAGALNNLANIHSELGDHDEAKVLYERALAIWERTLGPENAYVSYPLVGLTNVALAQHREGDAVSLAERALALREKGGVTDEAVAEARFVLARALWAAPSDAGGDRAHARAIAEQARDAYRAIDTHEARQLAEIEAWLAAHAAE